jgi:FKBP-type peptidyl-prolyl cis-trans isomerase FkpA
MKLSRSAPFAVLVSFVLGAAWTAAQAPPAPSPSASNSTSTMTEDEKTLYALGLMLGRNLPGWGLTPAELEIVKKGMADMANGNTPELDMQTYMPKVQQMSKTRAKARAEAEKARSEPFLAAAAKEPGAVTTPTGLVFRSLQEGTGPSPAATDMVKVNYTGTLIDGKVFDSSVQRGQPAELPLNGVIPCWTEGVQKMKVGGKAKLVCPSSIAYGDMGRPGAIPPGAVLVFDVELLGATPRPSPPPRPARPMTPAPGASPAPGAPPASPAPGGAPPVPAPSPAASPSPAPSPVPR